MILTGSGGSRTLERGIAAIPELANLRVGLVSNWREILEITSDVQRITAQRFRLPDRLVPS